MDKLMNWNVDLLLLIGTKAVLIYVLVIVYIRIIGKRSTSEFNNFDWIVTVCIGSIVASTVIIKDTSIVEGAFAVLVLLLLQFVITKLMYGHPWFRELVRSTPQLLLFEGEFLEENLRKERITKAELYAAIRQSGLKSVKQTYAIVLESNAKISIIANDSSDELAFSLADVQGLPKGLKEDLEKRGDDIVE